MVDQLLEAYPNDVKFVFKNYPLPFHKQAMPAAQAAIAAGKQGQENFWKMHDKIFENYRALSDDKYPVWAGEIGIDVEQFKKDFASPEVKKMIDTEMAEGRTAGVRGTPTIFINGKKPQGRSFQLYKSIIDEQLKAKKAG